MAYFNYYCWKKIPKKKYISIFNGVRFVLYYHRERFLIFRSSLYYWAHYDFFNNTSSGERVPNTPCDEVFPSWKYPKGTLRSPYNTLVYKKQGSANQDITCLYRFITDKRLYARIVLTVELINFKVRINWFWHQMYMFFFYIFFLLLFDEFETPGKPRLVNSTHLIFFRIIPTTPHAPNAGKNDWTNSWFGSLRITRRCFTHREPLVSVKIIPDIQIQASKLSFRREKI